MRDLSEIRKEFDQIDRKLLELFEARMELALSVAEYKNIRECRFMTQLGKRKARDS